MRLLLDEDSQRRSLVQLLREAGHDTLTVGEAGMYSHSDAEVFAMAQQTRRVLLTRNADDFKALHEADATHSGILVEYRHRDSAKNLSAEDIVRAIGNIEASGWNIAGEFVSINYWIYHAEER